MYPSFVEIGQSKGKFFSLAAALAICVVFTANLAVSSKDHSGSSRTLSSASKNSNGNKGMSKKTESFTDFKPFAPLDSKGDDLERQRKLRKAFKYINEENYEKALVEYDSAGDSTYETWFNIALCNAHLVKMTESERAIKQSIKINPMHAQSFLLLSRVLEARGKPKEALDAKNRYLQL